MKGFPTEAALLQAAHLTTPTVVKTPTLVPYIQGQLEFLEMMEARDTNGIVHDPVTLDGVIMGRTMPRLLTYNVESHTETVWQAQEFCGRKGFWSGKSLW
jgi:hypothetical protein